jgi:two-component system sensor histidine kinase SenX3
MQDLVDKVLKQTSVLAEQKGITIQYDKPAEAITARVDMSKLHEAMSNYVENAIKYSGEKTIVTVVLKGTDKEVVFEVSDQGMGVPETERKNLFSKFYRAGNARKEQPDGNGIGLFVVKSIAEGHGGEAYYKPLNPGSLFGFRINRDK